MTQPKRTPGPWKFRLDRGVAGEIGTVFAGENEEVCNLHGPDGTIQPDGMLIAAAPDLLEYHQANAADLLEAMNLMNQVPFRENAVFRILQRVEKRTLSVIAKAEAPHA